MNKSRYKWNTDYICAEQKSMTLIVRVISSGIARELPKRPAITVQLQCNNYSGCNYSAIANAK